MKTRIHNCLMMLILTIVTCCAQIDGLWLVKSVTIGKKDVTPVARWFRLDAGVQTSGNGWQQHSFGTYDWDKKTSTLSFVTSNEPADKYGAFKVTRRKNQMTWERIEDEMPLVVELELAKNLPASTADLIKGLWDLEKAIQGEKDVTTEFDLDGKYALFIRWDRIYEKRKGKEKNETGIWHLGAHEPKLKFISHNKGLPDEDWQVSFSDSQLILRGISEGNSKMMLTFSRTVDLPR